MMSPTVMYPEWGLHDGYCGADQHFHRYSATALNAVTAALSATPPSPPHSPTFPSSGEPVVTVLIQGEERTLHLAVPDSASGQVSWEVHCENGEVHPLAPITASSTPASTKATTPHLVCVHLPTTLPLGYHRLYAIGPDQPPIAYTHIIVAPARLPPSPMPDNPDVWGFSTQLYSLRSKSSWSIGDAFDLTKLVRWAASQGASFVSINPVFATAPTPPLEDSPYLPVSRQFFSILMLAVEQLPEYAAASPQCQSRIDLLAQPLRARNTTHDHIDRAAVQAAKLQAATLLFDDGMARLRGEEFSAFCHREGKALADFALWCAVVERYGPHDARLTAPDHGPSSPWAQEQRDVLRERIRFHQWVQWLVTDQLEQAQSAARAAGMTVGIIHDLPVGVARNGAETWAAPHLIVPSVSVGAPPDDYNQCGQNWNQPPWHPHALQNAAYKPFIDMVRKLCSCGGGLRIDHILGLFRLWWIPHGLPATEGVYVPYPYDDLLRIVLLEAHRHQCIIIGEDLGTVDSQVRATLERYGVWGTSVLWYDYDSDGTLADPGIMRPACMAAVTTHDMPPAAAFLAGDQVALRSQLGLLHLTPEKEWDNYLRQYRQMKEWGRVYGCWPDDTVRGSDEDIVALYCLLWHTPARAKCVYLADCVAEVRSENVPGTHREYPNWMLPLADRKGTVVTLEDLNDGVLWRRMKSALGITLPEPDNPLS